MGNGLAGDDSVEDNLAEYKSAELGQENLAECHSVKSGEDNLAEKLLQFTGRGGELIIYLKILFVPIFFSLCF